MRAGAALFLCGLVWAALVQDGWAQNAPHSTAPSGRGTLPRPAHARHAMKRHQGAQPVPAAGVVLAKGGAGTKPAGEAAAGPVQAGLQPHGQTAPPAPLPAPPAPAATQAGVGEAPDLAPDRAPDRAAPPQGPAGGEALQASLAGSDTILLPFDAPVGAASFALGGVGHVVFDEGKAIDLSALRADPVFGSARITLAPGSTHLTMAVPPGARLVLHRRPEGWALSVDRGTPGKDMAQTRLRAGTVSIASAQAADTVVLVDPGTGGKLLVGTVHDHGAAVLVPHASPEFTLLPSWEGVAVRAVSDRLTLVPGKDGFSLQTASGPGLSTVMADATQIAMENAGSLTRRFDIAPLPLAALLRRMDGDIIAAAKAPKQGRFAPRLRAAQDMLALGMDREAASLLQAARNDDPSQQSKPDAAALLAMARFLSGQEGAEAAAALADPGLGGSDEVALWRVLVAPPGSRTAAGAAVVAADWRLLTAYPWPLRRRLMPVAASILIDGNQPKAAQDLLASGDGDDLAPARARLLQAQGKVAEAIAALTRIAAAPDRRLSAQAGRDLAELRLQAKQITPAAAAASLQKQLFAWREPAFELDGRLRIAELLVQANDFRGALAQLRQAGAAFPDEVLAGAHDRVRAAEQRAVRALVQAGGGSALSPMELVALVDENTDLLSEGDVAASLTPVLVEKLAVLDLPERAEKLVTGLMNATADAAPKAALGARLAGFRLDQGDAAGALAALDQSAASGLTPLLDGKRAVLRAHALAQLGETGPALSLLAGNETLLAGKDDDDAWQLRAQLLEKTGDWHGAVAALRELVRRSVLPDGTLTDAQQELVLRLASAASQAGDSATLRDLQASDAGRLSAPRATLFQALSAAPVQGVADLPRAGREAVAAQLLPATVAAFGAR